MNTTKSSGLLSLLEGISTDMSATVSKMYDALKSRGFDVQELSRIEKHLDDLVEDKITFEQFLSSTGIRDSKKVVALTSELLRLKGTKTGVIEESEPEDYKKEKDPKLVNMNEPEAESDDFSDLNVDVKADDAEEEPDEFTKSVLAIMKHAEDPDDKYDADQLAMGIEVEKEHFDNAFLAKAVAKAHLAEIGDYYTRLKKMEDESKAENPPEAEKAPADTTDNKAEGE